MYRIISSFSPLLLGAYVWLMPAVALAAKDEDKGGPEWVLPFFLVLLFLGLALAILCRPSKRTDTALTQEEQDAAKAEKQKKTGH